jgi:hypothetical protein
MKVSGKLHASAALHPGENPRCPLHKRLGGLQSRPRRFGEEKNFLPLSEIETWPLRPYSIAILTELSQLSETTAYFIVTYIVQQDISKNAFRNILSEKK